MTVCFCGHGKLYNDYDRIKAKCFDAVQSLILKGADSFLVGDYGDFDGLAASVCLALRKENPIKVCLVLPYYQPHIDEYEKLRWDKFDSIITPDLSNTPHRFRIFKANQYMVNESDTVVAYVRTSYGGAAKTLDFAKKKGKSILNLYKMEEH